MRRLPGRPAAAGVLLLIFFGAAVSSAAGEERPANRPASATPFTKLGRGAVNLATGWMEVPIQTIEGTRMPSFLQGTLLGFVGGLAMGLARTGQGLLEIVTFPVGPYDRSMMYPDTVFGHFGEEPESPF